MTMMMTGDEGNNLDESLVFCSCVDSLLSSRNSDTRRKNPHTENKKEFLGEISFFFSTELLFVVILTHAKRCIWSLLGLLIQAKK